MTILSKSQVSAAITENFKEFEPALQQGPPKILIRPFSPSCLGPSSYDLHLGDRYISFLGEPRIKDVGNQPIRIEPRETFTVVSEEYVGLPRNVAGMVFAKVSWLERGLSQISSYVHPGFQGHLAETLTNMTDRPLKVDPGAAFCQIVFLEVPAGVGSEVYVGERVGQTVDLIMERLAAPHPNPRFATNGRKTARGFVKYLLGV